MRRFVSDDQVERAITTPPQDTRAWARSAVMRALTGQKSRYIIDWDSICVEDDKYLSLDDPLLTYHIEAQDFIYECQQPAPPRPY